MNAFLKSTQLTFALFAVYLIALYWIIVLKFNITAYHERVEPSINWIPFREAVLYGNLDLMETLLNILIFVPCGLYAGIILEKWSFGKKMVHFFCLSFLFELSQYLLKIGAFDITDLINNTAGGLLGLLIWTGLKNGFHEKFQAQKFINIVCLLGTIVIFSFLLFLKLNHLWIFRMELLPQ